jgi:hypothetical protein
MVGRVGPHRKSDSYGGPRERTLAEYWNGSAWSLLPSSWRVAGAEFLESDDLGQTEPAGVRA